MGNLNLTTHAAMGNTEVSVLATEGVLDFNTVGDFETALNGLFRQNQYKIIVDMEKLSYISSAGIGLLVGNLKEVRKNKGDIKISKVHPDVMKVFELMDLPAILKIHHSERDAAMAF